MAGFHARLRISLGLAVALGVTTLVVGSQSVGAGPFSMPSAGSPPKDIWMGPATRRSASKVKVVAGEVRVQGTVAGAAKPLGHVGTGLECVFEGRYDRTTIVGFTFPTSGSYDVRDTEDTTGDRLVGEGVIAFGAQGGTPNVYASDEPLRRLASVRASGGPVGLRATRDGPDLVSVDDGDWSFAIRGSADAYYLASAGACTATFQIQDVRASCGPFTGSASGKAGDVDGVSVDGTCAITVSVVNPGPGTVRVTRQLSGQAAVMEVVPPGGTGYGSGPIAKFEWTYIDADTSRTTTVNVTATIQ